ncbi:MAG TPA: hypothetical protein VM432_14170, partial [Bdellovibrionales bacterium]|nr:hypothetical protein [Bdellovibrionales bacterium]
SRINSRYTKIKTYNELMKMSRKQREKYISQIRSLVIELEAMQTSKAKTVGDARTYEKYTNYMRVLELMSATARAKEEAPKRGLQIIVDKPSTPQLPPIKDEDKLDWRTETERQRQRSAELKAHPIVVPSQRGLPKPEKSMFQNVIDKVTLKDAREAGKPTSKKQSAPTKPATATTNAPAPATTTKAPVTNPAPLPVERLAGEAKPAKPEAKPAKTSAQKKPEAAAESDTVGVERPKAAAPAEKTGCDVLPKEAPESCNNGAIKTAGTQFYSRETESCIYAGNFTSYRSRKPVPGQCNAPSKFCVGSPNCRNTAGESIEATFSCEDGQVICNPLLFGVQNDGKPFCIARNVSATKECAKISENDDDRADDLFGKPAFKGSEIPGLQEAWDEFANQFNRMCHGDEVTRQFMCRECHIINRRMVDIHFTIVEPGQCNMAMLFQDGKTPVATQAAPPAVTSEPVMEENPAPAAPGSAVQ